MDKSSYSFKNLESLYSNFMAPTFEIVIGNNVIDSTKIPISELTVEIDSGVSAGGCQFSFALQYNYETSTFASDIVKKIESDLDYPGQIKVHCIRENRAIEYAK